MIKIRMSKKMPVTLEWVPQGTCIHNSLEHLLPGDQNQHNYVLIKQETEFLDNTQSPNEDKEVKQENKRSNVTVTLSQMDCSSESSKKLTQIPDELCNRGRVDVVEMSMDLSGYKYIFVYEDQQSKFIVLKALRSDSAKEVAMRLLDILAIVGVPRVLQSGNGRKFAKQVVQELCAMCNDFLILYENAPKCEVSCKDFKSSLESWMKNNPNKTWREGLNFVQILHNTTYRCENGKVPCDLLFGRNMRDSFPDVGTETDSKDLWIEGEWVECPSNITDETTIVTTEDMNTAEEIEIQILNDEESENVQMIVDEHIEEHVEHVEEHIEEHVEEHVEEHAEEHAEEHVEEHVEEHAEEHEGEHIYESADENVGENADEHVDEYADEHANEQSEGKPVINDNLDDVNLDVNNKTLENDIQMECVDETDVKDELKTEEARSLRCKYCQKQYMKMGHLKNHLRHHKVDRVLRCKLYGKKFSVSRLRGKHMKQLRGQDKLSEVEKDYDTRSSTKKNVKATAKTARDKVKKSQASREILDINKTDDKTIKKIVINESDDALDTGDSYSKIVKKLSPSERQKLSTDSRISKIQCTLQCPYCKQKFSFPSVLERHMRSHTNERPYVCEICNKSFKQLGHLSQHALTHHDYRTIQCIECNVKFDSLEELREHTHLHYSDETMPKIRDMYRLFECDSCKKVFTTKSVLERHIFTHTQERQFDCKVCGKRFKQAGHVKSHMLVHTGERRFQCNVCSKRFSLSNSLKKHMYVHNGEKPYQCDVCGARFLEKRNLNGHLLTHSNERPHCCKVCGKRYTLADTLRRHVSAAHEEGRTYQCEICAKMFKQLAHLSVHKKVHNDERPFQCHLCEKNFKHKNVLKSHLAIHANVRPFECDECKATFVRKTNLQTHISSAHMNERPYVCTICGKRFKQISHLNGHVVVHSNLMPYKCDFCERRCNRLDNLKKHMRLHTKNKE